MRSRDLVALGVSREYLRKLCDRGTIERVGRGLYRLPGAQVSPRQTMLEACRRVPHGVIALLSALRFHDVTTQAPFEVWMAIDLKSRQPRVEGLPALSRNSSALLGRDAGPLGEGGWTTEGRYPASSPGLHATIGSSDRATEGPAGDAGPGVQVGQTPPALTTRPSGSTSSAIRPGTAHTPPPALHPQSQRRHRAVAPLSPGDPVFDCRSLDGDDDR